MRDSVAIDAQSRSDKCDISVARKVAQAAPPSLPLSSGERYISRRRSKEVVPEDRCDQRSAVCWLLGNVPIVCHTCGVEFRQPKGGFKLAC